MRHVTFNPLLFWISPGLISCIFIWNKKKFSVVQFYQALQCPITFYIFEHYQLWMMDSKGQRVFFPKTPQLCVWHTEVRRCYHFKLVSHFQLWFPIWGVLVNRLISKNSLIYSFREVMKVWLLNKDMLKRHLGDLALTSERGTLHNTAEWSDNKIGNIDIEELDEIKDGLRNM